ncbi:MULTISPECIES: sulfite exporter TauE/SafE family protein [Dietzia]|uniref:Probable membrane transporter protein n=1 Tax=Dietzia cercidiphylli TaxID=498199 RepID=A0ABP4UUY6_9ACTN|nr:MULTISPECIES: sulfite exporter TauE/SafE family protein [Dietzia]MBB1049314.1 sulfite exporter TauE/SafE family protein [Dietzia cercidiphylli]MBB1056664.1 sulfite exporter TauE/SafE family protein [Dietzia sp. B19]
MEITTIIVVALAVLVGLSLGLLGGGGSILVVPLLTYIGGLDPKEAIATSLFVVGATSLVSLFGHARKGNVRWRTGLIFGAAGMVGAFGGGLAGGYIPGTVLMVAFAIMMIATAGAMIKGRRDRDGQSTTHHHPLWRILLDGLVVGAATGLVGAGGGFLVVPALVLLAGLSMTVAVGTSLLVIAMKSFAGLGGYLTSVSLDWPLVAAVTAAAIAGSFVGIRLTSVVPEKALRKGFGFFVLLMGAFVLSQELPFPAAPIILGTVAILGTAAATCLLAAKDRCPLRSATPIAARAS